jgi:cold shock protein
MLGTVRWFREKYGFIIPDRGGEDVFIHHSNITHLPPHLLDKGRRVEFDTKPSLRGGLEAINIKPARE